MSNKKEITLSIIGVLTLVVIVIGSSYAYYVSRTNSSGEGSNVDVRTATLGDTTVTTEGSIGFSDTNIYPGHKNISKIKVTAAGDKNVLYNLTWTGTNTLNTPLKYYVYKTDSEETPTITCTKKEEGTIETILYEECVNNNFDNLGEVVKEGKIATTDASSITKLIKNEEIQATSSGATVYYYIVLEYENTESEQNIDMNGTFNGVVNTTLLEKLDLTAAEQILANKTISTRTDFSVPVTENTTGKIYTAEDEDGTSYYFAGAVDNNWVRFGGFYWRIIRINGDGTIRMIYNGTTTDQTGATTQIGTAKYSHKDAYYNESSDNAYVKDNAYVGYMYGATGASSYAATHTNTTSSNAKQTVDNWYNANLNKEGIKEHIDNNAGFCGDRTSTTTYRGAPNGSGGYGTTETYYGAYYRNNANKTPSLKCTNSNDLYTATNSSKGNKALEYPVGLISADEVAYAGGKAPTTNQNYYLYIGTVAYWTMSPSFVNGDSTYVFCVGSFGHLGDSYVSNALGVRPVINLKADTQFSKGDGSKTSPFEI